MRLRCCPEASVPCSGLFGHEPSTHPCVCCSVHPCFRAMVQRECAVPGSIVDAGRGRKQITQPPVTLVIVGQWEGPQLENQIHPAQRWVVWT